VVNLTAPVPVGITCGGITGNRSYAEDPDLGDVEISGCTIVLPNGNTSNSVGITLTVSPVRAFFANNTVTATRAMRFYGKRQDGIQIRGGRLNVGALTTLAAIIFEGADKASASDIVIDGVSSYGFTNLVRHDGATGAPVADVTISNCHLTGHTSVLMLGASAAGWGDRLLLSGNIASPAMTDSGLITGDAVGEAAFVRHGNRSTWAGSARRDYELRTTDVGALQILVNGVAQFQVSANGLKLLGTLPTSASGLSAGDVWLNNKVMTVV
jgi:hypothetical protein